MENKERKDLFIGYLVLLISTGMAMLSHWYAHTEQIMEFTILGYISASIGWMAFGILFGYHLRSYRLKGTKLIKVENTEVTA